jgi:hypothetical protein
MFMDGLNINQTTCHHMPEDKNLLEITYMMGASSGHNFHFAPNDSMTMKIMSGIQGL